MNERSTQFDYDWQLTGNKAGVERLAGKVLVVLLKVSLGGRAELQSSELEAVEY